MVRVNSICPPSREMVMTMGVPVLRVLRQPLSPLLSALVLAQLLIGCNETMRVVVEPFGRAEVLEVVVEESLL